MISRILSLLIATIFMIAVFRIGDENDMWFVCFFLCITLSMIWFGDALGAFMGQISPHGARITRKTPGVVVSFLGWMFLLAPLGVWLYLYFKGDGGDAR